VADEAELIIQVPRDSAVDRQLHQDPPPSVAAGRVVVERVPADAEGRILPPAAGEEVLSVLSPEALREADQVRRVIGQAADSGGPLVVIVQVAEELREEELATVLAAAARARRPVLLTVLGST
jgi:hypothetical protein